MLIIHVTALYFFLLSSTLSSSPSSLKSIQDVTKSTYTEKHSRGRAIERVKQHIESNKFISDLSMYHSHDNNNDDGDYDLLYSWVLVSRDDDYRGGSSAKRLLTSLSMLVDRLQEYELLKSRFVMRLYFG